MSEQFKVSVMGVEKFGHLFNRLQVTKLQRAQDLTGHTTQYHNPFHNLLAIICGNV